MENVIIDLTKIFVFSETPQNMFGIPKISQNFLGQSMKKSFHSAHFVFYFAFMKVKNQSKTNIPSSIALSILCLTHFGHLCKCISIFFPYSKSEVSCMYAKF